MTRQLALSDGRLALVDDDVFVWASAYQWHPCGWKGRYVGRSGDIRGSTVYLHRQILSAPKGLEVDHINGDTLDNRRSNLRPATRSQNMQNRHEVQASSHTGVRGVAWFRQRRRYRAYVYVHGRRIHLGYFVALADAALAAATGRARLFTHSVECGEQS